MNTSKAIYAAIATTLFAAASIPPPALASNINSTRPKSNLMRYCGDKVVVSDPSDLLVPRATSIQGRTPLEIHERFASIVERNFSNGSPSHILSSLSDKELADIARIYYQSNAGKPPKLMDVLASRLTSKQLVRVATFFGLTNVAAAVKRGASAKVAAAFAARVAAGEARSLSLPLLPDAAPAPTRYMTLQEIYLEYRTAPVGSLGPGAALSETTIFAGANLVASWTVGYTIGTGISNLIQEYDPSLDDAIGGTVAGSIDRIDQAVNDIFSSSTSSQRGESEYYSDGLYDYPVSSSDDPYGDWDDSYDMGSGVESGCY
jgi:hypothetical protein